MSREFDEAEFWRTVEAIAAERPDEWSNPKPQFDPKLAKDVRDDKLRGNKIGRYEQALRALGMVRLHPKQLGRWNDGRPHAEAMWVHPDRDLQLAFTETDVMAFFEGPKELYEWATRLKMELAAKRAGLVLPR